MKIPSISTIDLPGEFELNVSKNDILKDSKVIENLDIKSEFRNITQKVEKVVASPVQTVVQVKHSASQQSSNAFANRYSNPEIEHLPITNRYKVYDSEGKELSCLALTKTIRNPVDGQEDTGGEIYYEMNPLIVNLK